MEKEISFRAKLVQTAKYGENAWQAPAGMYSSGSHDPLGLDKFTLIAGSDPSFNNWAEIDRQLQTITHIAAGFEHNFAAVPAIAVGTKHGNPCGVGVDDDPVKAVRKMVMGDPRAIFGGLIIVNFPVTSSLATELLTHGHSDGKRLLDGISAPAFDHEAIEMMRRKGDKCRFLVNPALGKLSIASLDSAERYRYVRGGWLAQPNYLFVADFEDPEFLSTGELEESQRRDLIQAWAIGSTSNSNTVTLVRDGQLIGNGVGQQDRVGCCELAIKRASDAGHDTAGAAAYSDSFFPFPDGPEVLAKAGIKTIWATSGSVRDQEIQEVCRSKGVILCQVPDASGRGFFGH